MRRLVVVNQRSVGSLGLDSITGSVSSGAPPPGYTSQLDTTDNDEGKVVLNNSLSSMESLSKAALDSFYTLPSPSSIEDLRLVATEHAPESRGQSQNPTLSLHHSSTQGCIHGYTHTHSQCTPVKAGLHPIPPNQHDVSHTTNMRSITYPRAPQKQQHADARPESCDDPDHHHILSTDSLCGVKQPSFSSGHYRVSSTEEQSPNLPSSPYHHHHHQNAYSPPCADIRVLTYPSADEGAHEYDDNHGEYGNNGGNEEDKEDANGDRPPLNDNNMMMTMMMNSTATIPSPSEEPSSRRQAHDSAILPSHRRRHRHSHTKSTTKFSSNNLSAPESSDHSSPPLPLNSTHPTNYVRLSRKCTPSIPTPSKFWGRQKIVQSTHIPPRLSSASASSSAITGTFVIDPDLYIPPSLLNAMEDPVFRFKPSSVTETSTSKTSKRTNLRLEIEGGGIDVDIHLVPSRISNTSGGTCIGNSRNRAHLDTFCDTPVQAQVGASTSTIAFSGAGSPSTEGRPPRPSSLLHRSTLSSSPTIRIQENPAQPRKEGMHTSAVTRTTTSSSRRVKKKRSGPTTIDLRIKQAHGSLNLQNHDLVKTNGPIAFPLIARIHAPNPRPPFHLFASTIDIPNRIIAKTQDVFPLEEPQDFELEDQSGVLCSSHTFVNSPLQPRRRARRSLSKPHPQRVSLSHRGTFIGTSHIASASPPTSRLNLAPSSSSSSSSPLYLHLPRTFRGPLTIHISSGHVGDHLRLSAGLEREVALIRESEFGRGYFVGGLEWDGDMDVYGGPEKEVDEVAHSYKTRRSTNNDPIYHQSHNLRVDIEKIQTGRSNEAHAVDDAESSSVSSASIISEDVEWCGDRIEILVGSGDVYLQFEDEDEDEDDPFRTRSLRRRKGGFWKMFSKFF